MKNKSESMSRLRISRRLVSLVGVPLLLVSAVWANQHEATHNLIDKTLRTTIVVYDFERAYDLFDEVLNLPVVFESRLEGEAVNQLLGQVDKSMRIAIFDVDGTPSGRVALLAYDGDIDAPEPGEPRIDPGDVVIVFETRRIDEVYERVKKAGYAILSPPAVLFPNPGMVIQAREMIFMGPAGVAINLIQRGVPGSEDRSSAPD